MSGSSYNDTKGRSTTYESYRSSDSSARSRAVAEHRERVVASKEKIARGEVERPPTVSRDVQVLRDPSAARNRITSPSATARQSVVVLVDNSGSNRVIAEHLRNTSGHLMAFLRTIDPDAEIAFIYFSDHGDGSRMLQYSDFVPPTERGDKILYNSLLAISTAGGADIPEAIECAFLEAARINHAQIPVAKRTLILVTDSVAHGMGYHSDDNHPRSDDDDGCPDQVSWRDSLAQVRKAYGKFILIGSGSDPSMRRLQMKFFEGHEESVGSDFMDLSDIQSSIHRNGIVGNSILFILARNGGKQVVPGFLANLYAKWLANPLFGEDTDYLAQVRIRHMAETYLQGMMSDKEIQDMLREVFAV